jgi:chaperone BCS1
MLLSEIKSLALGFMNEMSGGDPVVRGLIGVWMLSVFGYLARSIPNKIRWWIYGQATVSMTIIREGDAKSQDFFLNMEAWFLTTTKLRIRNRKTTSVSMGNDTGFGYGSHLLFCNGRFYKLYKKQIEKQGTNFVTEQITITTFGRDAKVYEPIIAEAKKDSGRRYFWEIGRSWSDEPWLRTQELKGGPRLFLEKRVEDALRKELDFFLNNRAWYIKNAKPYRMNIMLYGPPGTGKTELVRWIADYVSSDIYQCLVSRLTNDLVSKVSSGLIPGRRALISLEDMESIALSRDFAKRLERYTRLERNGNTEALEEYESAPDFEKLQKIKNMSERARGIELSDFLNMLQGLKVIEDLIIVMTTNHIDVIDEAVLRGSRCDLQLYVGPLGLEQVKGKFEHQFEQPFPNYIHDIKPIKACDLDALSSKNAFDADGFLTGLIAKYGVTEDEQQPEHA